MKDDEEKFMKKLIEFYVNRIDNLENEVTILSRALALSCNPKNREHADYFYWAMNNNLGSLYDYFIERAKKELKELRGE